MLQHEVLKRARRNQDVGEHVATGAIKVEDTPVPEPPQPVSPPPAAAAAQPRKRRPACTFSDSQVMKEMDVQAVKATRSYKAWMDLKEGEEFIYNQKYVKGKEGHDWLIKKNIWRRMRYRRENKKMVHQMRDDPSLTSFATSGNSQTKTQAPDPALPSLTATAPDRGSTQQPTASEIVDQALTPLGVTGVPTIKIESHDASNLLQNGSGNKRKVTHASVDVEHHPAKIAKVEPDMTLATTAPMVSLPTVKVANPVLPSALPPGMPPPTVHPPEPALEIAATMHHHHHSNFLSDDTGHHHDADDAALTAAAAATASGAGDDLVELSAVEAAVAAAASYVHYQNQAHGDDDDDEHDPLHDHPSVVHNPLEVAANAAALDSAAKIAAAATAQESQLEI
jgi:hypothetical protein